ncbi:MAG: polyribonucleotide nucleotidyltransferase [Planctomycetota bacterium]
MSATRHEVTVQLAGTRCTFETGRIAALASGAVLGRCGDSVILATVVVAEKPRPDTDFLPLQVEYREKLAAAGRIPGSFTRREGRITDHEVLTSRLIDRTVRSLFPGTYRCEVQIQINVLSADPAADLTTLAIVAAGAALHLSAAPADGPAAGMRIVRWRDGWHAFPSARQRAEAELDFIVSAGPNGLVMVEGEAREVSEELTAEALETALPWLDKLRGAIDELRKLHGTPKQEVEAEPELPEVPEATRDALAAALRHTNKAERRTAVTAATTAALDAVDPEARPSLDKALNKLRYELVRGDILQHQRRLDGRGPRDIRPIWGEVGWLPRTHGSAIFTRGETQALVSCTLGTVDDAQRIESLAGMRNEQFLLHYNFPPYSVNEARPLRGPGRREIGHGFLARRGLLPLLPSFADFPFTIRLESEISMSNGSSSMATVCGGCMAMLDAGVPLSAPVAGIAMGMVSDGERLEVLSDILGDEDHLGDMDFKVVGTHRGITALQLDNKIGGLSAAQLAAALEQAGEGRRHILDEMAKVIDDRRDEPSQYAPRFEKTAIMPSAIGQLVGPRGANIRGIEAETGARVTIDDDAVVRVYAADPRRARTAMAMVQRAAGVLTAQHYYRAVITSVRDFGAFARVNQANEGLIPLEELDDKLPRRPGDVVSEGAEIVVKVLGIDGKGRLRLSRKQALGVDEALIVF